MRDPLVRAAQAQRERIRARSQLRVATCLHPLTALRYDGTWIADEAVYALVTCLPESGGCGTSKIIRVRDDVALRALREQAGQHAGERSADVLGAGGHEGTMREGAPESHSVSAPSSDGFGRCSG